MRVPHFTILNWGSSIAYMEYYFSYLHPNQAASNWTSVLMSTLDLGGSFILLKILS